MAAKKTGVNKSAFIRDYLTANPKATANDIASAYSEKHKEKLAFPLIYQQMGKLGLGKRRKRRQLTERSKASGAGRPVAPASNRKGDYHSMEGELDKLIGTALVMSDSPLVEKLKQARRLVSSRLI